MKCPKCGHENSSRALNCSACHAPLGTEEKNTPARRNRVAPRGTTIDQDHGHGSQRVTKVEQKREGTGTIAREPLRPSDKKYVPTTPEPSRQQQPPRRKTVLESRSTDFPSAQERGGSGQPRPKARGTMLESSSTRQPLSCVVCGARLKPTSRFCNECGTPTKNSVNPPDRPPQQRGETVLEQPHMQADTSSVRHIGFLLTFSHDRAGRYYPLFEGRNTVSRDRDADVSLFFDGRVSAPHAEILFRPSTGQCVIIDKDSVNGTVVNGEDLGYGGRKILQNGDIVTLGDTTFKLFLLDFDESPQVWPGVWG